EEPHGNALICGISLFLVPISVSLCWVAFRFEEPAVRAVGLLIVPASIAAWVTCTIKGLHRRRLSYWLLPSTYVLPSAGGFSLILLMFGGTFHSATDHQTFLDAAAIVSSCGLIW